MNRKLTLPLVDELTRNLIDARQHMYCGGNQNPGITRWYTNFRVEWDNVFGASALAPKFLDDSVLETRVQRLVILGTITLAFLEYGIIVSDNSEEFHNSMELVIDCLEDIQGTMK